MCMFRKMSPHFKSTANACQFQGVVQRYKISTLVVWPKELLPRFYCFHVLVINNCSRVLRSVPIFSNWEMRKCNNYIKPACLAWFNADNWFSEENCTSIKGTDYWSRPHTLLLISIIDTIVIVTSWKISLMSFNKLTW